MNLQSIQKNFLPFLLKNEFGNRLFSSSETSKGLQVSGACGSSISIYIAALFLVHKETILYVIDDKELALYATAELENLVGKGKVFYFPASQVVPYQIEKTQNANLVLRTEVLQALSGSTSPKIIVAYAGALSEKVLKKEDFKAFSNTIKTGDLLNYDFVDQLLQQYQFSQVDFVSQPGEFSVRGGIVDVFSYSNENPYRISFFGNEIDSIKMFDIETQLTTQKVPSFQLVSNMNHATTKERVVFLDSLPKNSIIVTKNGHLIEKKLEDVYTKAVENFSTLSKDIAHLSPDQLFVSKEEYNLSLQKKTFYNFSTLGISGTEGVEIMQSPQPFFHKNFQMLLEDLLEKKNEGYSLWISFSSEKQKERLASILEELGEEELIFNGFLSDLHEGFIDHEYKILVYTDHQIFDRYQRFQAKNSFAKSEQLTLKDLMSLKVGDYIAHIDHGIGKFLGLVKVNNNGKIQECFKLTYKNNDLLYVSIHSLHKISKYNGPDGKEIQLSKLGSPAWKSLKQKTKARVKQIAFDLIKLYAERKTAKGFAYSPDSYLQHELEASFLYEDTPDQEKATIDVKKDMEADTVMDRLVCGDVGFGKTEVAIRAAFKAATDGKQVAILVPTTILAFQHFRSFQERLSDFPVTVAYLNRFRTAKQKAETLKGLEDGTVDIVIGTHQLTSEKVKFKDLGLLIIDEEHKFGVAVKDKLKTIKSSIDTLTLTATPIPRTLQFSLMAARDLSVIKTPPPNRQPVETQLIDFDEVQIRDAISYEIQRDGQVYFINNRIENLKDIAGLIQRLVPDAKVVIGHGQMDGKKLEENVLDFMNGKYDVLVATTIVESGVDVPNANTIFINDAQRFGMADLHQMRGRVGRSNRKAFCYLITPPFDMITPDSRKRLEAISQFSDLGSGFQIAMIDLEIRGAGDLLGGEQSGFINEMGFDMYQKLMQEALEELQHDTSFDGLFENEEDRKKLLSSTKECNIDTDLELMLPDTYISNTEERLLLYQRLAEISNPDDLSKFTHDLIDRFGALPHEAQLLLDSVALKWIANSIGFEKIIIKNEVFLGYFPSNAQDAFYQSDRFNAIINYLTKNPAEAQLKQKIGNEGTLLYMKKTEIKEINQVNLLLRSIDDFILK